MEHSLMTRKPLGLASISATSWIHCCLCVWFTWQVDVQEGLYVELIFLSFHVYENPVLECERDMVIITDYDLQGQPSVIGRYVYIRACLTRA